MTTQWQTAKLQAARGWGQAIRVMDEAKDAALSKLSQRHDARNKLTAEELRATYLWDNARGAWSGPFNLSAPGELGRYLAKRNDRGGLVFSLGPPEVPALVRASDGAVKKASADPERSGRSRRHRGRRH